jgi:hypothetical protein
MPRGIQTNPEIKLLIVKRAKEGDRIDDLAREFSLYPNTIRKWLAIEGVSGVSTTGRNQRSTALLLAKAEREKQDLINIIGKLTIELSKTGSKKKW